MVEPVWRSCALWRSRLLYPAGREGTGTKVPDAHGRSAGNGLFEGGVVDLVEVSPWSTPDLCLPWN